MTSHLNEPRAGRSRFPLLLVGLAVPLSLAAWMVVSEQVQGGRALDAAKLSRAEFEEATGVRLVHIAVTAGGGMLDLRYQVLDPDKALVVHDDDSPPTILDEASGRAIRRPWMEHHDRELHTAVTYHELIMNSGGVVKRGSQVTLAIGDARLEHVVVQ